MAGSVKELRVWQEAVALGGEVVRAMRQSSRKEVKSFTDHVVATAVSVATGIADGYGRPGPAEQRQCYRDARRALLALETMLAIARQAGLLSATGCSQLTAKAHDVARLLAGYLAFVDRQIAAEEDERARRPHGHGHAHTPAASHAHAPRVPPSATV